MKIDFSKDYIVQVGNMYFILIFSMSINRSMQNLLVSYVNWIDLIYSGLINYVTMLVRHFIDIVRCYLVIKCVYLILVILWTIWIHYMGSYRNVWKCITRSNIVISFWKNIYLYRNIKSFFSKVCLKIWW